MSEIDKIIERYRKCMDAEEKRLYEEYKRETTRTLYEIKKLCNRCMIVLLCVGAVSLALGLLVQWLRHQ